MKVQYKVKMIVSNLEIKQNKKREPQKKLQYSGGFRGYHPQTYSSPPQSQTTVSSYVDQLGIGNLAYFYEQQLKAQNQSSIDESRVEKAVNRLYLNSYPQRKKTNEQSVQVEEEKQRKKIEDLYGKDAQFQKKAQEHLVQKDLQRLFSKLHNEYEQSTKEFSFTQSLSLLLLNFHEKLKNNDELLTLYRCSLKQKLETKNKIPHYNLKQLKNNFAIFQVLLGEIDDIDYDFQTLSLLIKEKLEIQNIKNIKEKFPTNKTYTVPFDISLNKVKEKQQKQEKKILEKHQIKANPVPKSTYQDPKEKQRPEPKKTQIQPFNLTEDKGGKQNFEEYYQWKRQFQPNPVPQTTYKPEKISLLTEEQKKMRAKLQLQKASYPKTMQYLNKYSQAKEEKKNQIIQKHQKERNPTKRKQIPNFNYLHAKNLTQLQIKKQQNQKQIKVEPFKFAEPKPKVKKQNHYQPKVQRKQRPKSAVNDNFPVSKSTKKYEAYLHFRKEDNNKKQKKQEQKQKEVKKKEEKQKKYGEILKDRMYVELHGQPRPHNQYQASNPIKMSVDYEKIYTEKPLLMESKYGQKDFKLPWDCIF